jgi:hypothetical protein
MPGVHQKMQRTQKDAPLILALCLSENLFLENKGTSSDGGLRYAKMYWK